MMTLQTAQRYYKFHTSDVTDRLLAGQFKISSTTYFSALSFLGSDNRIGDLGEGAVRYKQTAPIKWQNGIRPPEADYLAKQGIMVVIGNATVILRGGLEHIVADAPGHILSLAMGEHQALQHQITDGYNASVEIIDPAKLAHELWSKGTTKAGTKLDTLFGEPSVKEVQYGLRVADINQQTTPDAGPFWKGDAYRDQKEFRLFFPLLSAPVRDQLLVSVPEPARFVANPQIWADLEAPNMPATIDLRDATTRIWTQMQNQSVPDTEIRNVLWRWRLEEGLLAPNRPAPYDEQGRSSSWVLDDIYHQAVAKTGERGLVWMRM